MTDEDLEAEATENERWLAHRRFRRELSLRRFDRMIHECGLTPKFDLASPITIDDHEVLTVGVWGGWLLQVTPMGFNDRVILTPQACPSIRDFGWCYDKGGSALLALLAWDPEIEGEPAGFKKRVGGLRRPGQTADETINGFAYAAALIDSLGELG